MIAGRDRASAPHGRTGACDAGGFGSGRGRGTRGESLTEVLAAIVVGGLALLLLAMAISTSANMNRSAREAMDAHYKANNALSGAAAAAGSFPASVTIAEEGSADAAWSQVYSVECVTEGAMTSYELPAGSGAGAGAGSGGSGGGDAGGEAMP